MRVMSKKTKWLIGGAIALTVIWGASIYVVLEFWQVIEATQPEKF